MVVLMTHPPPNPPPTLQILRPIPQAPPPPFSRTPHPEQICVSFCTPERDLILAQFCFLLQFSEVVRGRLIQKIRIASRRRDAWLVSISSHVWYMRLMKFMEFMNIIGLMLCIHVVQSMKFINPSELGRCHELK